MQFDWIADIYQSNAKTRERLHALLKIVSPEEAEARPDGKWCIREIIEHIAIVDEGTARICRKLLDSAIAAGAESDGRFHPSDQFAQRSDELKSTKLQAPERVQPTGEVSIEQALDRLEASRKLFLEMRTDLATHDLSPATFPHPFLGDLNAAEWLAVAGGHEFRHIKQIERQLAEIRQ